MGLSLGLTQRLAGIFFSLVSRLKITSCRVSRWSFRELISSFSRSISFSFALTYCSTFVLERVLLLMTLTRLVFFSVRLDI